ncbi:unnamed protein product [Trifolium pratense]|uniref:Uncharacterized protein n=1 Tax=Trifolium pratense TaxID=57577 RepID=A0ACB0LK60_TRIPR|nr:unnamed protein product [Trifolium pratense]
MAMVEDKNHSHDQISTPSVPMNNNYTRERDLFNKFLASENQRLHRCHVPLPTVKLVHQQQQYVVADELDDDEDLELSLGLSMNGRFGFDPNAKKIKRTTSIPESMIPVSGGGVGAGGSSGGADGGNLIRTCSLPAESEEEWRKRKELQTQRRLEARRKRNEKQRNLRAMRERNNFGGGGEGGVGIESGGVNSNNLGDGLIRTTSLASRVGGLGLNGGEKEKDQVVPPSPPQGGGGGGSSGGGSIGSSSGTSESEGQQHGQAPMDTENSSKIAGPQNKTKDLRNLFEDMPSVSTKGEGPNGKRIEGFLYKYGKGEQVRILCVCHGSFLTPAEFVKHAGGGDVANPLKHIVVSSSLN